MNHGFERRLVDEVLEMKNGSHLVHPDPGEVCEIQTWQPRGPSTPAGRTILERLTIFVRRVSLPMLRGSLGLVFGWFGALKIAGISPVATLVARTMPFFDARWFIPALGAFEVALAIAVVSGRWFRSVGAVMAAHLCGTFLVFLMQPSVTFQNGNPLLLTSEGEFVLKNLVLIAGCFVLATTRADSKPAGLRDFKDHFGAAGDDEAGKREVKTFESASAFPPSPSPSATFPSPPTPTNAFDNSPPSR